MKRTAPETALPMRIEPHGGDDITNTITRGQSGLGMTVINVWNRLKRRASGKPRNPVRELCEWRDEKNTLKAIATSRIAGNEKCRHCGNYDFTCGSCVFVGQTAADASCNFWEETD